MLLELIPQILITMKDKTKEQLNKKLAEIQSLFGGEPVYSKFSIIEKICLFISRWKYRLTRGLYLDIKYFIQRHTRGYDDLDKWNAAWYIARKSIPVLTAMRNSFKGTSLRWHREDRFGNIIELTHDEVFPNNEAPIALTENEWCEIIDDIIYAFKFVIDQDELALNEFDLKEYEKSKLRHKRGLKLFSIYIMSLWD